MKKLEEAEQRKFFKSLSKLINTYPQLKWIHSIPNGGSRNKLEAYNLKLTGVKSGVLDVFFPYPSKKYHGLYIEFKSSDIKCKVKVKPNYEYLSDNQKLFWEHAIKYNYKCALCFTASEAIEEILNYLKITQKD